jgi:tetratricopeptide (TPR) repeat protein
VPLLQRPNAAQPRFFPAIDRLLQPDGSTGGQLLALAESPFRLFKPRTAERRAAALVWLYREGIRAELENRWRRADFFWDEANRILNYLDHTTTGVAGAFKLLVGRAPSENNLPPDAIAARVIDEIFIDTHAGFFNGRVKQSAALPHDDRAFSHLQRIKMLLPRSQMIPPERAAFLRPTRRAQFEAFKQNKAWKEAAKVAQEMLEAEPDDLGAQERFIETVVHGALATFSNDNSEAGNRREATALQVALRELDAMRTKMALNEDLYSAMCQLHHMCAIRLANSQQLSQALLSVQKALTIDPNFEEAEKNRTQLFEMMNNLQSSVKQLEEQVRRQPNASLTEQGRSMQREARAGFGPLNQFVQSKQATELGQAAKAARNIGFWCRLGLTPPADRWPNRAESLLNGLTAVLTLRPTDRLGIKEAWKTAVRDNPDLDEISDEKVIQFLAHRLLGDTWEPAKAVEIADPPEPSNPPLLTTAHTSKQPGGAPFMGWIYSGQDLGMKLRWAAILVLVAVGFALGLKDGVARARCDRAFAALTQAAKRDDAPGVMAAAEQFLSVHPFATDPREPEVISAYRRAMVEWFAGLRKVTDADQTTIARFRTLTAGKLQNLEHQ